LIVDAAKVRGRIVGELLLVGSSGAVDGKAQDVKQQ
jgi:hypothetical protein